MKNDICRSLKQLGTFVFLILWLQTSFAITNNYYIANNTVGKLSVQQVSENGVSIGQGYSLLPNAVLTIPLTVEDARFKLQLGDKYDAWTTNLSTENNVEHVTYLSVDGPGITAKGSGWGFYDPIMYSGKEWGFFAEDINGRLREYIRPRDEYFTRIINLQNHSVVSYSPYKGEMEVKNIGPDNLTISLQCPHTLPGSSIHRCQLKTSSPATVSWRILGGRILRAQPTPNGIPDSGPYQLPIVGHYSWVAPIGGSQENIAGMPVLSHQGIGIATSAYGISLNRQEFNIDIFFDEGPALSEVSATVHINSKYYEISVPIILVQSYVLSNDIKEATVEDRTPYIVCDSYEYMTYSNHHYTICKENDGEEAIVIGEDHPNPPTYLLVSRANVELKGPTISNVVRGTTGANGANAIYMLYRQYLTNDYKDMHYECGARRVRIYDKTPVIPYYLSNILHKNKPPAYLNHLFDYSVASWNYIHTHSYSGVCNVLKYGFVSNAHLESGSYDYLVYDNDIPGHQHKFKCKIRDNAYQKIKIGSQAILGHSDIPRDLFLTKTGPSYTLQNSCFAGVSFGYKTVLPHFSNCVLKEGSFLTSFVLYLDVGSTSKLVSSDPMPANTQTFISNWYDDFYYPVDRHQQSGTGYFYNDGLSSKRLISSSFKPFGHRIELGTIRGASDMFYEPNASSPGAFTLDQKGNVVFRDTVPMQVDT